MTFKKIILGFSVLYLSISSFAAETIGQATFEAALKADADQLATMPLTDAEQAYQNLIVDDYVSKRSAEISSKYKDRLAGIYVEHVPQHKLIVRIVGNQSEPNKILTVPQPKHVRLKQTQTPLTLSVEFQANQKFTREQMSQILDDHLDQLAKIFPDIQGTYVDERTGEIVLDTIEASNDPSQLDQAIKLVNVPVRVVPLHGPLELQ